MADTATNGFQAFLEKRKAKDADKESSKRHATKKAAREQMKAKKKG